jgi:hypothetical protein
LQEAVAHLTAADRHQFERLATSIVLNERVPAVYPAEDD